MNRSSINMKTIGVVLGPLVFIVVRFFLHPSGLSDSGLAILASMLWVAIWWVSEVVEVEVTALLPIVLFPLSGGLGLVETCTAYGHKFIFLFLGGFILAIAIQKWNLHKRIALSIIYYLGTKPGTILLGFMLSTAFMSMWISNTATAVMMLPIALAVSQEVEGKEGKGIFTSTLLLSIAYSASIGGIATLIGTPPNLILAGVFQKLYGMEIGFMQWMTIGLPVSLFLLAICWYYLFKRVRHLEDNVDRLMIVREELRLLGPISFEEKRVLVVFLLTALMWCTRSFLLVRFLPELDDTMIAIFSALVLFLLPSSEGKQKLLEWKDAVKLPWGILILFGGGIAIAEGFDSSGLSEWFADNLQFLAGLGLFLVLLVVVTMVNFLTEITSNLATTSVLLPVLASLAVAIDIAPYYLMVGATLAASCAFMLPVATPPNAIVFGSEQLTLKQMMRTGFVMNLLSIAVITLFVYFILPLLW